MDSMTIDDLVLAYQNGDEDSGLELLNRFAQYIKKYMDLLKYKRIKPNDKDLCRFISLFSNREYTTGISSIEISERLYSKINGLSRRCATVGFEDILQEMKLIILTLAMRYKKTSETTTFCGYLYNTFNYELFRKIKEMSKDPIVFNGDAIMPLDFSASFGVQLPMSPQFSEIYQDQSAFEDVYDLGENWINGLLCDRAFVKLTNEERMILKYSYIEKLSDTEIGKLMGLNKRTVYYRRTKAEDIVAGELGEAFVISLKKKRNKLYSGWKRKKK